MIYFPLGEKKFATTKGKLIIVIPSLSTESPSSIRDSPFFSSVRKEKGLFTNRDEGVLSHDYFVEPASSEELRQVQDHGVVARAQERGGVVEVVYRGVSWPRARCEQPEPDDFRALRVASLKVIVFLSLESRGDFEGRAVGRVEFFFPFFFFNLTRMKDAREYIARVKLFDAFVKFVYFFYGI